MADPILPDTIEGRNFLLYHGNGANPEIMSNVCGIQVNKFSRSKELTQTAIVPCDPPGGAPVMVTTVGAKSATIDGSGVYAAEKRDELDDTFESGGSESWAFVIKGQGYYTGRFNVASLNLDGAGESDIGKLDISMQNDGTWRWVTDLAAGAAPTFTLAA